MSAPAGILAAIEWDSLLQVLWAAPAAGVAVAVTWSLAILGVSRAADTRRSVGVNGLYAGYVLLAIVAGAGFFASVAFGLIVITSD